MTRSHAVTPVLQAYRGESGTGETGSCREGVAVAVAILSRRTVVWSRHAVVVLAHDALPLSPALV